MAFQSVAFQSVAFQSVAFQTGESPVVVTSNKGGIHPWYYEEYHRIRLRKQQNKLIETKKEINKIKKKIKRVEKKEININVDITDIIELQENYKKRLTFLSDLLVKLQKEIRETEDLITIAIAMRRRLRIGLIK